MDTHIESEASSSTGLSADLPGTDLGGSAAEAHADGFIGTAMHLIDGLQSTTGLHGGRLFQ